MVPAGSKLLVLAGQVGQTPDGGFPESLEAQFAQALADILAILACEGGDAASIARLTCFATERPTDRAALAEIMAGTFGEPYPAMSLITVAGLFAPHVKAEI